MKYFACFCFFVIIARTLGESGPNACCPPGFFVSIKNETCYKPEDRDHTSALQHKCRNKENEKRFHDFLYREGQLYIVLDNETYSIEDAEYCVGTIRNKDGTVTKGYAMVCTDEDRERDIEIYGYFMLASVVFLTATVIIYAAFRNLRDLFGKSIINLCGSLTIALLLMAITRLTGSDYSEINICVAKGFTMYFFLLASFFWTTAVSFQVFRSVRNPSAVVESGWKPFIWYALFAWGSPAVLTIIAATVHHIPGDHTKPFNIGEHYCWFYAEQQYYYLYSVMGILLAINILIFSYTFYILWRYTFASTLAEELKTIFWMSLRLFTVMGIVWIFQFIVIFDEESRLIWTIIGCITSLQGLWIFLFLVVFRRRVVKELHNHGWLPPCTSNLVEKWLARGEDKQDVIDRTSVPLNDQIPK